MTRRIFLFYCSLFCFACGSSKQAQLNQPASNQRIAFYNVENLFDIYDAPDRDDDEFTPGSKKNWTEERYQKKLNDLSKVFGAIEFPVLIGLCEVENEKVLVDLSQTSVMKAHNYGVVHFESQDRRGIDNALLYQKGNFKVLESHHYPIDFPKSVIEEEYTTRDIVHVKGMLYDKHLVHLFVNHWPSRRGGLKASEPKRLYVAQQLRNKVDALFQEDPNSNIIIMGDFNDEPDNKSVLQTLGANNTVGVNQIQDKTLYNCSAKLDQMGEGTYNYRGNWNMLDQFIVSNALLRKKAALSAGDVNIFKAEWLIYNDKKYGPKPNKTYGGPNYYGGTSDHYPIYMELKANK